MFDFVRKRLSWHWVHSFLGLWGSLILMFIFLTGTLAVFGDEIDWIFKDEMRAEANGAQKLDLGTIYDTVLASKPEGRLDFIHRYEGARFADRVTLISPENDGRFLWVNPYTGAYQGETTSDNISSIIHHLHAALLIPHQVGLLIVTSLSLVVLGLLVAGVFLLPRFWKSFVIMPRFNGSSRAMFSDLHRLIGAWSILFLIPIVVTSLFYLAETLHIKAPKLSENFRTDVRETSLPPEFDGIQLNGAIEVAKKAVPGFEIRSIILPGDRRVGLILQGDTNAKIARVNANSVYVDPRDLSVLDAHEAGDLSAYQRVSEALDPLHYGYFGGLTTRILWFVFGLGLVALAGFGAAIYAIRMGKRIEKTTGTNKHNLMIYWKGMGLGAYGSVALIGVGIFYLIQFLI